MKCLFYSFIFMIIEQIFLEDGVYRQFQSYEINDHGWWSPVSHEGKVTFNQVEGGSVMRS